MKMNKNKTFYQCEGIENEERCNKMVHVNDIDFYEHHGMELLCLYHFIPKNYRCCGKEFEIFVGNWFGIEEKESS